MRSVWQDLRIGIRALRREPVSALVTSLTLGLGIGLCTTAFSLVYGVFGRGLNVPEANRLTLINRTNPSRDISWMDVTEHDFYDWSAQQTSFEALAHFTTGTVNLSGTEGPERYDGAFVSANLFDVLRVPAVIGTTFRPDDDAAGAPLTVVLGYQTWATRYRSDPHVVGTAAIVNGEPATILGVMPKGFRFPSNQELWVAQRDTRALNPDRRRGPQYQVVGRLAAGVPMDRAEREMSVIAERLAREYPASNAGVTTRFRSFVDRYTGPELRAVFGAMQVATLFVLLIAIANVANLLLARATLRVKESAVRTALGATRLRVVLPFFAETGVLAVAGALVGLGIAYVGVTLFDGATQGVGKPYWMSFTIDLPVLAFVMAASALTAFLVGAAPAFHVLRTDVNATLKDEARGSSGILGTRLTRVLVVAEVALSCALLIGAGLMIKSIANLRSFKYPFATENVFTARIGLFEREYPDSTARHTFFRALQDRLATVAGARSVALTTSLPASDNGSSSIGIAGEAYNREQDYPSVRAAAVTPGFFETFGVPVLAGRDFTASDDAAGPPVAIVNRSFAARFFANREALGQRFAQRVGRDSLGPWKTIVGIVPDQKMEGFDPTNRPEGYYVPLAQQDPRFVSIVIQAAGATPLALTSGVREAVRALDPNLPIYDVYSMKGALEQATWFYGVFGTVFIVFGGAALFMATVGLYGVLSFSVNRRTREMGIRMALGANAGDVIRVVMLQGGRQLAVGLALGLALAYGLTRVIGILMFQVTPQDPPVFTLVVAVIAAVGLLASLVPARRATRTPPTVALRYE
jgi:putative ABC transport system permease protein